VQGQWLPAQMSIGLQAVSAPAIAHILTPYGKILFVTGNRKMDQPVVSRFDPALMKL